MNLDELIRKIESRLNLDDPEDQQLIARITTDATLLTARKVAGEDVDQELIHLTAQAMNLSATAQQVVSSEIRAWILGALTTVLSRLSHV